MVVGGRGHVMMVEGSHIVVICRGCSGGRTVVL